ncbi:MAG: IS91 family transposase [Chitinophagaceae bacterium]|nr:IS91 family transposase [Chitinophagaceae bacterium]
MQAVYEVAGLLEKHWLQVEQHPQINSWQLRTLGAIMRCRTAALGGHKDVCTACGTVRVSYNSCRNRHCPKCQGKEREQWIRDRETELLAVPYFHVVFTLPDTLNKLAMHQSGKVYDALFDAAWDTVKVFGGDVKHLGADTGMISILHTWGQQLTLHPHLHCIIPGGGLTRAGKWKKAKSNGKYLFPAKAMSKVFRAKYVAALKQRIPDVDRKLLNELFKNRWVVYAKRAFGNGQSVVEYLGRYTHKIAISNHRITAIEEDTVRFTYKDYRKGASKQELTLHAMEFIRRFTLHILPKGFVRIRHYGILSSTRKKVALPVIKAQTSSITSVQSEVRELKTFDPKICPCCKTATMITIELLPKRGPPRVYLNIEKSKQELSEKK